MTEDSTIEPSTASIDRENAEIAARLDEAAALLEEQGASHFRIAAYRRAAREIATLDRPVREIYRQGGEDALIALPGIGHSIAGAAGQMLDTGRWPMLDRLRGESRPEVLFQTLPGVGPDLAQKIHDTLHVDTLEALELAAYDGRLEQVPGIGPRRQAAIRDTISARLSRRLTDRRRSAQPEPSAALLLEVDGIYRARASRGALPLIAPKRFNPRGERWLPILHLDRDGWYFTVLFSNTAMAHRLGRTHDWVVIFFSHDHSGEGQRTVVTETRGPLEGQRVIRGREAECRALLRPGA